MCNGAKVVDAVRKSLRTCGFDLVSDHFTSAEYSRDGLDLFVINSGFIGRIDNYAKRRLRIEIEQIAEKAGVYLQPERERACFLAAVWRNSLQIEELRMPQG